jgi:cellobiose epimerase
VTNAPTGSNIAEFRQSLIDELDRRILPFWMKHAVDERGGFIGRITHDLTRLPDSPKGVILNTRILWTFSAAYGFLKDERYRSMADRAFAYLNEHFWDEKDGGLFWLVNPDGSPLDDKKKIYGQAFGMYALAEYHRRTSSDLALDQAKLLFDLVEANAHDVIHGGYFETYNRDWTLSDDLRLSEHDMNEKKSMNTHLHLLEAYTCLFRTWKDPILKKRLTELIQIELDHIINPATSHFILFFDEVWTPKCNHISFGHDIEGSWLLVEAAEALGDKPLIRTARDAALRMARAVLKEGIAPKGGLYNEADPHGISDPNKDWWPQAEAVVGFLNAYQISGDEVFWEAALSAWDFIQKTIVDRERGEWHWRVSEDGVPDETQMKVSEWKCPYHNGRMCLEAAHRLDAIKAAIR